MECPKCGGPMWDNRQTKKSPKQPDYKCKDRQNCDGVIWPPKGSGAGTGGAARGGNGAGNGRASRPLGPLYYACMQIAAESVKRLVPNATPTDIVAATATLFIGATNTGAPLRQAPAPKPAPKPEPEPEPEPEPDYDDIGSIPF